MCPRLQRWAAPVAAVGVVLLGMAPTAVADPGAVPTPDQVGDILNRVLDPNVDSADKSAVVTPSLSPEDETQIAAAQRRLIFWNRLPLDFVVTDIQPAPNDYAGATVAAANLWELPPTPIVLNRQGGQWQVTDDTLTPLMYAIWHAARDRNRGFAGI